MVKLEFRLGQQMEFYQKGDSTTTQVSTLTVNIIQVLESTNQGTTHQNIAISNITWVSLLLLIRPVKYCIGGTYTPHHPFRL